MINVSEIPPVKPKIKLGVLVSGGGTNLQAIIDAIDAGTLDATVEVVISNRKNAFALERARSSGISTEVLSHRSFETREEFDRQVTRILERHEAELVVLAGFMRLLSAEFVQNWKHRLINVHPSLLPAFPGVQAQRQALEHGVKVAGCSVFFVDEGMDTGPIIIQAAVPVYPTDSEAVLSERILQEEHRILPLAIQWIAHQQVQIEGRHVHTPSFHPFSGTKES